MGGHQPVSKAKRRTTSSSFRRHLSSIEDRLLPQQTSPDLLFSREAGLCIIGAEIVQEASHDRSRSEVIPNPLLTRPCIGLTSNRAFASRRQPPVQAWLLPHFLPPHSVTSHSAYRPRAISTYHITFTHPGPRHLFVTPPAESEGQREGP